MAIDRQRLNAELRTMRTLIEKDPAVRARFDADANGVIDGHEWEQVRRLVIARLEREDAECAAGSRAAAEAGERARPTAAAAGALAQEIYDGDLSPMGAASVRGLADAAELILERQGGPNRRHAVYAADGEALATIEQAESQMLEGPVPRSPFEIPDLCFAVTEAATADVWTLRRGSEVGSGEIEIHAADERLRAIVTWTLSFLRRSYSIAIAGEGGPLTVYGQMLRPLTLRVLDPSGEEIGAIERGWTGLGAFASKAERMRIRVRSRLDPAQRIGLVAAALLEDLAA